MSQSYNNIEYIIIDGASTDGTLDIVMKYSDRLDYWLSEPDGGISDAFNKGIAAASGDFVGLINAGDELLPDALKMVAEIVATKPDIQVLHGDVLLYLGNTEIKRIQPAHKWWFPWKLVLFNHPATFVRKDVYQSHGTFDKRYRIAMDVDLFLRWMRAGVVIDYFATPLVKVESGGISGSKPFRSYGEARQAFLANGFNRVLVDIHYVSKMILHMVSKVHINLRLLYNQIASYRRLANRRRL